MKYLLDTCTFLWMVADPSQLSPKVQQIVASQNRTLYLSVVSAWEIAVKYSLGKLTLHKPPRALLLARRRAFRVSTLQLRETVTVLEPDLPKLHKDPFDRMLICQAIHYKLTILTPDALISQYPVQTDW